MGEWLGSLKLRITVAALAALVVGIGLITLLLVQQAERQTLAADNDHQISEVVRAASLLSHRVIDLQKNLQSVAGRIDHGMLADDRRLIAYLESQPALRGQFSTLFLAGPQGPVRVLIDEAGVQPTRLDLSDRSYFQTTVREGRAIVSEVVAGSVSAGSAVVFTTPVLQDASVQAVLGGVLRLSSLDLLENLDDSGEGDEALTVVTDASGRILAHPDRERLMQPLTAEPRLAKAFAHWMEGGSAVEPAGLLLHQTGDIVSMAGVPAADWLVWRSLPEDDLLAPLRAARSQALGWAAGLSLLLSALLLAWLNTQLRPLRQLEDRARHLFDTEHAARDDWPEAAGEIGRLSRVLRRVGSERLELEALNRAVLRKLSSVMSSAPVGIAFTRNQRFELVSAELCRLLGRSEEELLNQQTQFIYASNEDYMALGQLVRDAFAAGQPYVGEWRMLRADGSRFWGQLRGRPVDPLEPDNGAIWTINDVSDQVAAREHLEWSVMHDPLTGVANRKALDLRLARLFDALPGSLPAELVMIDLDHFKPVNDSGGHAAGDAMLKAVATAISSCVRAGDLVARTGGDEFVLLLEQCSHETALNVAETVRLAITSLVLPWDRQKFSVGASLGVASLRADTPSTQAWLAAADTACYVVKAAGRGAVRGATLTH